ncbi:MAG TPA: metal ABC transporter permease [Candidatus Deferrimicrobium sp.]|nr:metal ABC transporter permease [Candidatus Deferrimicrobium sp.]
MNFFIEPLQYAFMQRALVGTAAIGILCAVLGTFVVLRKIAFIGEGLAHGSLAGLAIGYLLHANLYIAGNLYTAGLAMLIGYLNEKAKVSFDTAIGIIFSTSMALGVALISRMKFYTTDLTGYLFGSVLSITDADLLLILSGTLVILGLIMVFYKELVFCSFDSEMAEVAGVPRAFLHYLLLLMIATAVVIASQTLGIILVTALLVTPAAGAYQLTNKLGPMLALSASISLLSSLIGLFASYYLNVASGASIALTAAMLFIVSYIISPKRKPLRTSLGLKA